MQTSKMFWIGFFSLFLSLGLLWLWVFKDNALLISSAYLKEISQGKLLEDAYIQDDYVYFTIDSKHYKIAKDSLDLKELGEKIPLQVHQRNDYMLRVLEFVLLFLFFIIMGYFVLRLLHSYNNFKKSQQEEKENKSILTKNAQDNKKLQSEFTGRIFGNTQTSNKPISYTSHSNRNNLPAKMLANDAFDLQRIQPIASDVTFEDVAGISQVKEELEEIIDYLKNPQKYQDFGVKLPKGVLLVGPPGVGKTLIAKALAGEAGVPFFYQSGASFVQIYVGMGAKRVRDLFTKAKLNAPSIVFIDEIDAVGKARGGMRNDEREATLNQLLTEMDGFEDSRGVIVIGATNQIEVLDEALLRSGRFDRRVYVELPDHKERTKILEVHCRDKKCDVDFEEISRACVGFSGAALAALVNEAALHAIKRKSPVIQKEDFLISKDKVLLGTKRRLSFSEEEKKILALYQGAKALGAYWLEVPFDKITLLSDGIKGVEKELASKSEMTNKIKVYLSGIVALELFYSEQYSHSKEDLDKAKVLAQEMVERYGMGEFLIGSGEDIVKIVETCRKEIKEFFENYRPHLQAIANALIEAERLEYHQIEVILKDVF